MQLLDSLDIWQGMHSDNMKNIIKNLIKKVYSLTIIEVIGWRSIDHRKVGA